MREDTNCGSSRGSLAHVFPFSPNMKRYLVNASFNITTSGMFSNAFQQVKVTNVDKDRLIHRKTGVVERSWKKKKHLSNLMCPLVSLGYHLENGLS